MYEILKYVIENSAFIFTFYRERYTTFRSKFRNSNDFYFIVLYKLFTIVHCCSSEPNIV